ncbi:hypothetical protein CROQUDRAFT_718876 [Cronartium quercuum f. sp. fusiforme G11]|uniref:Uncharacterized protein n=1 Tax=Cronartium quercuum f. sp. fusiforme G11 TaxID=708437 RepID=A0A9P6T5F7_9BASI|nr:hypothetical protein CROQUDRAFT_718876 [Cronartium quercuum f. sp. fusiforme G11]
MSSSHRAIYRKIYRTYQRTSNHFKSEIPHSVKSQLRNLISQSTSTSNLNPIINYLIASKAHEDLVKRYNPAGELTDPERLKATVNRVGLNLPKQINFNEPLKR